MLEDAAAGTNLRIDRMIVALLVCNRDKIWRALLPRFALQSNRANILEL